MVKKYVIIYDKNNIYSKKKIYGTRIKKNIEPKMCDCEDSSDFSDDQNRPMYAPYESKKFKKLNFTNYDTYDINEKKLECAN